MASSVDIATGATPVNHVDDYNFGELFVTFASSMFHLKATFIWKSTIQSFATNMFGGLMDKFARRELDFYFSRTNCARYLYVLTAHVLWPGGVWDDAEEKRTEADKEKTRAELLKWFEFVPPAFTPRLLGRRRFDEGLRLLLTSR